jgi:hypothetical protein
MTLTPLQVLFVLASGVPIVAANLLAIVLALTRGRTRPGPAALVVVASVISLLALGLGKLTWLVLGSGMFLMLSHGLLDRVLEGLSLWTTAIGAVSFALLLLAVLVAARTAARPPAV